MSIERRCSKRYRLDSPIRFRLYLPPRPDTDAPFLPGRTYDLSEGGMRFLTDTVRSRGLHILHPDTTTSEQCRLEIELSSGESSLTLHGQVVWYDRTNEGDPFAFQVGVRFSDLTKNLKKEIQQVIRRLNADA